MVWSCLTSPISPFSSQPYHPVPSSTLFALFAPLPTPFSTACQLQSTCLSVSPSAQACAECTFGESAWSRHGRWPPNAVVAALQARTWCITHLGVPKIENNVCVYVLCLLCYIYILYYIYICYIYIYYIYIYDAKKCSTRCDGCEFSLRASQPGKTLNEVYSARVAKFSLSARRLFWRVYVWIYQKPRRLAKFFIKVKVTPIYLLLRCMSLKCCRTC